MFGAIYNIPLPYKQVYGGDGVAQLVERRTRIQRPEVRTPAGAQYKFVRVFKRMAFLIKMVGDYIMPVSFSIFDLCWYNLVLSEFLHSPTYCACSQ